VSNLDVAHDLFDLGRDAVRSRDGVAQAHRPANDLEICAARTAIMLAFGRVGSALRTEHIRDLAAVLLFEFEWKQSQIDYGFDGVVVSKKECREFPRGTLSFVVCLAAGGRPAVILTLFAL
jgi:hypothetical protein